MAPSSSDAGRDCPRCPRLVAFREAWRSKQPDWFNAPVPSFGPVDARLLIVGLAPGLQGANRTGRPFTGDYAGDLLYATLIEYGFAAGTYRGAPGRRPRRSSTPASPMRCAACRRKTSRTARKSRTAAISCAPPSRKCRTLRRSSLSAGSPTTPPRWRWAGASRPQIRPRRDPCGREAHRFRQLSLLALQHQHRRADDRDVPRGVCGGALLPRCPQPRRHHAGALHRAERPDRTPW